MSYDVRHSADGGKEIEAKFGRYNDMPPNAIEISREEFDGTVLHGSYLPDHIDYRQIVLEKGKAMQACRLYIFHDDTGYMVASEYVGYDYKKQRNKFRARYFKFARCYHEFVGMSEEEANKFRAEQGKAPVRYTRGNCCHNYICKACGDYKFVDSSD